MGRDRVHRPREAVLNALIAGWTWGDIALDYVKAHYGNPAQIVSGGLGMADYVGVINDMAAIDNDTLTLDKLFAWSHSWIDGQLATWIRENKAVANNFGVPLHAYEGGQSFIATNGRNEALKRQAQTDPRMADLYRHLVRSWTTLSGGGMWGAFSLASRYDQFGYWGLLENITQPGTVKYDVVKQLINESV